MKRMLTLPNLLHLWLLCVVANSYVAVQAQPLLLIAILPAYLLFHLLAGSWEPSVDSKRIRICNHGAVMLLLYAVSVIPAILYHVVLYAVTRDGNSELFRISLVACAVAELAVFINGILCVHLASRQLPRRKRLLGAMLGWIPVLNFTIFKQVIGTISNEVKEQELLSDTAQ